MSSQKVRGKNWKQAKKNVNKLLNRNSASKVISLAANDGGILNRILKTIQKFF